MKSRNLVAVCVISLNLGSWAVAQAGMVVESMEIVFNGNLDGTFTELPSLTFGMIENGVFADPDFEIFLAEDVPLTTADIGTTFVYTGSTVDEIRNQFADSDLVDQIGFGFDTFGVGFPTVFHAFRENDFTGFGLLSANDLAATGFNEIRVTILDYADPVPFMDMFGNEFTNVYLATRFDYVVPEPATGALLCSGVLFAIRRRRCRA